MIILDLPTPPSINAMYGAGPKRLFKSGEYRAWERQADLAFMAAFARGRRPPMIDGPFEAIVTINENMTRADLDNVSFKLNFDWAQRVELISNDKLARRLVAEWGDAPQGCRLVFRPISTGESE